MPHHPRSFGRLVTDHEAYAEPLTPAELTELLPLLTPHPDHEYIGVKRYSLYDPEKRERRPQMRRAYPALIIDWDKTNNEIHAIHGLHLTQSPYVELLLGRIDPPRDLEHLYQQLEPSIDSRYNAAGLA